MGTRVSERDSLQLPSIGRGPRAGTRWLRLAGALSMNLALGTLYAWSVFVAPLEREFGWTRAETSTVFTIAVIMFATSLIVAGRLQDKFGPFWFAVIGAVSASLGFFLSAYTSSLHSLYVYYGVLVGVGNGFGYGITVPVMAKWFPDKRGLAVGLALAGYGAASAIFGPIANLILFPHFGWRTACMILGVVFLIMTLGGALTMKDPPPQYSLEDKKGRVSATTPTEAYDFTPAQVFRTSTFYLMWLGFAFGCSSGLLVISQLIPFAANQGVPGEALATIGLVIGAAGSVSGRILSGWVSDQIGRLNTLRIALAMSTVAIPIMYWVGSKVALLYLMVFIVYFCYGTQASVNASTVADFWGIRNSGVNYALLFTGWGVAGIIGPTIGGILFDRYHNYRAAFYFAAALSLIAFVCEMVARRPQRSLVVAPA